MISRLLRIAIFFCLLCSHYAHALQVPTHPQLGIALDEINAVSYLRDPSGKLSLQEIVAQDIAGKFAPMPYKWNAGYTKDAIWMKFTLEFATKASDEYWLEISPAILDDIQLFIPHSDGSFSRQQLGDHQPVSARPIPHRNFIFPLHPPTGVPQTYYVRLQSTSSINFHATVWEPRIFINAHDRSDSLIGAYYGVRLFLALFALILWLWLRHKIFMLYSLYQSITSMMQAFLAGTAQLLIPVSPLLADTAQKSLSFLFIAMVLIFYSALFQLDEHQPRLMKVIRLLIGFDLVMFAGVLSGLVPFNSMAINLSAVLGLALMFFASIKLMLARHYDKLLFIFAIWIGFLPLVPAMLHNIGIPIGTHATVMDSMILWPLLSLILTTLGLIYVAKHEAEKKLQAKEVALELSKESERLLDLRVDERTRELARANEELNKEISERQALQSKLEVALARKKELMAAQQEFFAMASHEFRTPLAIIDTTSQRLALLDPSSLNAETNAILIPAMQKIRRATQRMSRMIDNFLTTDKLDSLGSDTVNQGETCDLRNLVEITVKHYQELSSRRIETELSETAAHIQCDQYLINLVVSNLLDNALKYSPVESIVIARVFHGQHYCHIEIEDFGQGIAADKQETIFGKYTRLDSSATVNGTGLGLHVARMIAEKHGGLLIVRSEPGYGSCFRLTLPRYVSTA
ncbi:sensor histidine kinase [Methylobacillus caricis]|uniref:sensor histidine kinase n=1 Tax=Methylobacillus caricis TaxID=1971611 RepID=UPI001CFFA4BA|nr:sensor histidine kinase [Methylobacillus caricis]MCB5188711.1 sensor histidine kinase [Methylobacillus caricis]